MYTPDVSKEEDPVVAEVPSLEPLVPDHGDIIAVRTAEIEAANIDPLTGMAKLYHAEDPGFAALPKADTNRQNATLALVGVIGSTVALLGVGGYALNRAMQKRKTPVSDETETAETALIETLKGEDNVEQSSAEGHQFSFDWQR